MENMENNNAGSAAETTTVETGNQMHEKKFTQEEVNGFVQSRLAREKAGLEKGLKAEYDSKMAELNKREMKLIAKEKLADAGLPKDLVDLVSGNTEEEIETKISLLSKYHKGSPEPKQNGFVQIGAAQSEERSKGVDPIRKAMGIR